MNPTSLGDPARRQSGTRQPLLAAPLLCGALLAGCGGGSDSGGSGDDNGGADGTNGCTLAEQKIGLRGYMLNWYLFNKQIPDPDPARFSRIEDYFYAMLVSTDQWSFVEPTAAFEQFFSAGETLGYGISVAGRAEDPEPVRIRYIAPGSPADVAGLTRGMIVEKINGIPATTFKTSTAGFSVLNPGNAGQTITLTVHDAAQGSPTRTQALSARVYPLVPVARSLNMTSSTGIPVAYLHYKDFINAGQNALQSFFKAQSALQVKELILDLRYNGGGLISISRDIASGIAGNLKDAADLPKPFVTLRYNSERQAANHTYQFGAPATWSTLNLQRVYVLTGPRTCSASELVINGLVPHVQVVQIGSTTCGKPYGFSPLNACGNTYNAINFDSVNANGAGGYVNGLSPTAGCLVTDDLDHQLGDPAEALTAAALRHIDTGQCTTAGAATTVQPQRLHVVTGPTPEEGERRPGTLLPR
ncbi:MAG: hypothetical protein RLY71_4445 [Pseudomonadota bacterium]|jgi:C-terminal processing protease CtpA/Prc